MQCPPSLCSTPLTLEQSSISNESTKHQHHQQYCHSENETTLERKYEFAASFLFVRSGRFLFFVCLCLCLSLSNLCRFSCVSAFFTHGSRCLVELIPMLFVFALHINRGLHRIPFFFVRALFWYYRMNCMLLFHSTDVAIFGGRIELFPFTFFPFSISFSTVFFPI